MDEHYLRDEERIVFSLRSLYGKYGYLPYQMSKFEEYELYIRHKEFMVSDQVIAFNDTNGKLLALKPDVTLSIIKSGTDEPGVKQKVFYNENVYRVSSGTHRYKEIMQAGLECIGDTDLYDTYEVLNLAAESLAVIGKPFVLAVSHLGVLSAVLNRLSADPEFCRQAAYYIAEKNPHDLERLCSQYNISDEGYQLLLTIIRACGKREDVLSILRTIPDLPQLAELETISSLLSETPYSEQIQFDFSLVGNTTYYNGYTFKGFADGIASAVLSGGQYDRMMEKMGRKARALGFALYLDLLVGHEIRSDEYDVDFLILYDSSVSGIDVAHKTADLQRKGFSCTAQKAVPSYLRYKEIIDLRKVGSSC